MSAAGMMLDPGQDWVQFEVKRTHYPPGVGMEGLVWVKPANNVLPDPRVRLPGCSCAQWFEIVVCTEEKWEDRRRAAYAKGITSFICRCFGEFVE